MNLFTIVFLRFFSTPLMELELHKLVATRDNRLFFGINCKLKDYKNYSACYFPIPFSFSLFPCRKHFCVFILHIIFTALYIVFTTFEPLLIFSCHNKLTQSKFYILFKPSCIYSNRRILPLNLNGLSVRVGPKYISLIF